MCSVGPGGIAGNNSRISFKPDVLFNQFAYGYTLSVSFERVKNTGHINFVSN